MGNFSRRQKECGRGGVILHTERRRVVLTSFRHFRPNKNGNLRGYRDDVRFPEDIWANIFVLHELIFALVLLWIVICFDLFFVVVVVVVVVFARFYNKRSPGFF